MQISEIRPQHEVNVDMSFEWTRDSRWATTFIPSLTQALYTLRKPFEDFKRDSAAFLHQENCMLLDQLELATLATLAL